MRGCERVEEGVLGMCTSPPAFFLRKDGIVGELDFCYPNVSPAIIAHERMHAVADTFAFLKLGEIVPSRPYTMSYWNQSETHKEESRRHEVAACMMDYFMDQIHSLLVTHGLWEE